MEEQTLITCKTCSEAKIADEFAWENEKEGKKSHRCKTCQNIMTKAHYKNNKSKYNSNRRNHRKQDRDWLQKYKSTKFCALCGETHSCCLEFHHKNPKTKKFRISDAIGRRSRKEILREISKCLILCSNCHKKLHHNIRKNNAQKLIEEKILA